MCLIGLPEASTPLWQLEQIAVTPWCSNRAGSQATVVWQFWHVLFVAMCFGPLPVASAPLWQLAQLPVTPAWERPPRAAPLPSAPRRSKFILVAPVKTVAAPAVAAGALTTVPTVLRVAVAAATVRFAFPPFQLLVLWQPLQSWPTWWPFGRVVRVFTP